MTLYTTAKSCMMESLESLATCLSECPSWQELTETADDDAALATIVIGPFDDPKSGPVYSESELDEELVYAHIIPDSHNMRRRDDTSARAEIMRVAHIYIHRQVREVEVRDGYRDPWQYFADLMFVIMESELWATANTNGLYVQGIEMLAAPGFTPQQDTEGHGEDIQAHYEVSIGKVQE